LIGLNTIRDIRDEKMIAAIKEALSGRMGHYEDQYTSVTAGKITPVKCEFAPILSQDGGVTGGIGMVEEITDRKKAEEALRESEEKYRSLFDNAPVGIFQTSSKGQARYVNPYMAKLVGAESPEVAVTHFTQLSQQLYVDTHRRDEFIKLLKEEGKVTDFEYEAVRIDGTRRYFTMNARASELLSDGSFLIDGFTSDITERKQAEAALREKEQQYRLLADNTLDIIWQTDLDLRFTYVNPAVLQVAGYSSEESIGTKLSDYCDDENFMKMAQAASREISRGADSSGIMFEAVMLKKNKEPISVEIHGKVIVGKDGLPVALQGVTRDITERKKAEQERESLQKQLLQAQKMEAIGTLAGGIAHDFNNLLQVILGYADLLLLKKEPKDPERKKLEVIQHAARDGADLVARILTFSRKGESQTRPMDLNDEIRRVEKLLRRTLPKMIQIDLLLADDLGIIDADPAQIEQVTLNLGVNAQHAMPEGGRLIIETSNVSLSDECVNTHLDAKPGKYVLLTVSDTGIGMPPGTLDRIFEPFFTTKTDEEGTGLGLAMVHGIVAQHGGYIRCHSEPGSGTSFKIYFPVSSTELLSDLAVTGEMPAFGSETVLLVDDDDRVQEITRQIIEMGGYKVLVARSGEEALIKYRDRKDEISLVILDLIMPGMGGKECLRELRQIQPKLKVLIASGFSDAPSVQESIKMGANGFIYKPFNSKELLLQVRRVLDEASMA
jgi:two-component system, cell cycle sensor histidine kinase and response regulator CckA